MVDPTPDPALAQTGSSQDQTGPFGGSDSGRAAAVGSLNNEEAGAITGGVDEEMSMPARGALRVADALPDWLGSIRFRLTALYSVMLFGLAAFMVAGLYGVLASRLHDESLYRTYQVATIERVPGGVVLTPTEIRASNRTVEALANARALSLLRTYSIVALGALFISSMIIGWFVAGRVLGPIGRITATAREIGATDLSRRISLRGPPDELKELADTFDEMLRRLDEAFAGQQRFIQEASHELRNPLAVMRTNIEVALADPDQDPAELRRVGELVAASATRMSRLVDDLLVYARLGAPAREVAPVALGDLVVDVADEFQAVGSTRNLNLIVSIEGNPSVAGDRLALRQAVANLVANAVRLAPERTRIWIGTSVESGEACVRVTDEGPGIADEDRPHVFDRFWRGDKQEARAQGRSGLGLAIVAQIVADHGGSAEVAPTVEHGSVFTLRFPQEDSQETSS